MNKAEIDRDALIAAVETEIPQVENFLDLHTGEVVTIVGPAWSEEMDLNQLDEIARDNRLVARQVRAEPDRYIPVPSISSEAGFRWMQEFTSTVADHDLRDSLQKALHACADDCFQAFRRLLTEAPDDERERWFAFRDEKIAEFLDAWLEGRASD